eukprot:UN19256
MVLCTLISASEHPIFRLEAPFFFQAQKHFPGDRQVTFDHSDTQPNDQLGGQSFA